MTRTPLSVRHKIDNAIDWYGSVHSFYEYEVDEYGEPTGETAVIQQIDGIYHDSRRDFLELITTDGGTVKAKANKGILVKTQPLQISQGTFVDIYGTKHKITAIEPIMYCEENVGTSLSLEESLEK